LDNDKKLPDYGIQKGDTLNLEAPMDIKVRMTDGTIMPLEVQPTETIEAVKKKIEQKKDIPVEEQHLYFSETELDNDKKLPDYGIQKGDTLNLEAPMDIKIRMTDGTKFPLEVQRTETIEAVKEKIEQKKDIPVDEQRLSFGKKQLDNDKKLGPDYGIRKGDTLNLEDSDDDADDHASFGRTPSSFAGDVAGTKHPMEDRADLVFGDNKTPRNMTIYVKTPRDEKTMTLEVVDSNTIEEVKAMVEEREGIPAREQRLIGPQNQKLDDDDQTLLECEIKKGDYLKLLDEADMHIFIKNYRDDKVITLQVAGTDTIIAVKGMVEEKEGIPTDKQCLSFKAKNLENNRTLESYVIRNEETLFLLDPYDMMKAQEANDRVKERREKRAPVDARFNDWRRRNWDYFHHTDPKAEDPDNWMEIEQQYPLGDPVLAKTPRRIPEIKYEKERSRETAGCIPDGTSFWFRFWPSSKDTTENRSST